MNYSVSYERKLLKVFYLDKSSHVFLSYLDTEYFMYSPHKMIFSVWKDYYIQYKSIPPIDIFVRELKRVYSSKSLHKDEIAQLSQCLLECYSSNGIDQHEIEYVKKDITGFVQQKSLKNSLVEALGLIQAGQMDLAQSKIQQSSKPIVNIDVGDEYVNTFMERILKRAEIDRDSRIPTMVPTLDTRIGGGLAPKELGILLAPTGTGKSMVLINFGFACTFVRKVVLHITLDMSSLKTMSRYDSLFTGIATKELNLNSEILQNSFDAVKQFANLLYVKELPRKSLKVSEIGGLIDRVTDNGPRPDMLIVDYGDCLRPSKPYSELRFELKDIFDNLSAIASEYNMPVWTATQAGRKAFGAQHVSEQHVDESISKIFPADLVVSLSQTLEEKKMHRMRLVPLKVRDNYNGDDILIETDFAHARLKEVPQSLPGGIVNNDEN